MRSFDEVSLIHAKSTLLRTVNLNTSAIFGKRDMTLANNILGTKCSRFGWLFGYVTRCVRDPAGLDDCSKFHFQRCYLEYLMSLFIRYVNELLLH